MALAQLPSEVLLQFPLTLPVLLPRRAVEAPLRNQPLLETSRFCGHARGPWARPLHCRCQPSQVAAGK